jgi:hypothetical protein
VPSQKRFCHDLVPLCLRGGDAKIPVNAFLPDCPSEAKSAADASLMWHAATTTPLPPGRSTRRAQVKRLLSAALPQLLAAAVTVPTLDLGTEKGGLRPFGKGGGRQTTSLKLIAADSSEYVFRSVDKDVTKILPPELRNSVAADVLRDITVTAHPYSALVTALSSTTLYSARPAPTVSPARQPAAGPYREQYAGLLGTLEDRPGDPKPNLPGFGKSDEVTRSFGLFRKLYKDHDNRVDAPALARARAFDMLVADFGKHEDNWKWAGYKEGKTTVYRPIPRDRDQSFTLWNGLLTYIANREWAVPSIEDFQSEFNGLESLNWPARHLDRFLLQGLSRQDWQTAARYLQTQLTPAVIDEATAKLPTEIQELSGKDLNRKLKARIQELPKAVDGYYELLAKRVDVVGSNKGEVFLIERLPAGALRVQMFDRASESDTPAGPALFDRTFLPAETNEVAVYGLDGRDIFTVSGNNGANGILLRIIGGKGNDRINDDSRAAGLRTLTKVYDTPDTELQAGPETNKRLSNRPDVNAYDREQFEYDGYTPRLGLFYNRNDGFGASVGFDVVKRGFRKPDYKNKFGIDVQAATEGLRQITLNTRHRYAFGKVDAGGVASYGNFFPFYNFFGIGNDTKFDQNLRENNYYRARYKGYFVNGFLERVFRQKSVLRLSPSFESYQSDFTPGSLLGQLVSEPTGQPLPNTDDQQLLGLSALLDLDFRDRQNFARRGARLRVQHDSYRQLNGRKENFGLSQGFAEYYGTARLLVPATLVLKGGGSANYGPTSAIPFYKLTSLGQAENLRGYYRTRFTGDASLYLNSELRLALGQVKNGFLPFYYGVFGFYDQGRVYYEGNSPGGWHTGYGGGFYIAPVVETLALSVSYQVPGDATEPSLIQVGLGFRIDR